MYARSGEISRAAQYAAKIFKFPRSGNFPTGKKKREKRGKEKKEEEGAKKSKVSNCHSAHADVNTYVNANINYFYETYCRIGHPGAWATCQQAHCERLPLVQVLEQLACPPPSPPKSLCYPIAASLI